MSEEHTADHLIVRRRESLSGEVKRILSDRIAAGRYPIGSRLPSESDMIAEFSVSRTVIREAIANLKAGGLVKNGPRLGGLRHSPRTAGGVRDRGRGKPQRRSGIGGHHGAANRPGGRVCLPGVAKENRGTAGHHGRVPARFRRLPREGRFQRRVGRKMRRRRYRLSSRHIRSDGEYTLPAPL